MMPKLEKRFDCRRRSAFTELNLRHASHRPANSVLLRQETMREHLPSLLIRTSVLLRAGSRFFRRFAHPLGVGLLSARSWPWISSRRPPGKGSITVANPPRKAWGSSTVEKQNLCKRGDSRQPEALGASGFPTETADRRKNKNLIISIHIPKTGGTTFVEVLQSCAEEVLYLDYDLGGGKAAPTALFHRGKTITAPLESIISDLESLPGRSVIHGHFRAKKYTGRFPHAVYVTWLRDPVERIISNYLYWQRSHIPGDRRWEQFTAQKMTLEQFSRKLARNNQQAFLSPLAVEEFDFIGITEEYDRSLELFRRLFCPEAQFDATVQNKNPNRQGKFYDLDPQLRKKILQFNERDAYIYVDGVRRFRYLCAQVGL
jgi:hypothetical protein